MLVQLKGPPTVSSTKAALRLEVPWGSGARYMCGGPHVKIFWTPVDDLGSICRPTATVQRKGSVIKQLLNQSPAMMWWRLAERIAGLVERTPLIATEIAGDRIWLKCECLQTGGAFKLRGATNRLLQLVRRERERGVVAFSSGNHARGVAIAAKRLGIQAIIVMPADAPAVKIEGTRSEGAEIIFYDRATESREEIAARIAEESGATVVPSFDDPAIVAGQGTVGLEMLEQLQKQASNRRRGSSSRAAAAGLPRGSPWPVRTRTSWWSSPRAGTTCAARSSGARSCRSRRTRRRPCAMRSRRRACRRSPSDILESAARKAWRSATRRSRSDPLCLEGA